MSEKRFEFLPRAGLLLLAFVISLASSCIVISDFDPGWNHFQEIGEFERTFEVGTPAQLEIRNGSGDIRIQAGEETKIIVNARVKARGSSRENAQRLLEEIVANPPLEQTGKRVVISRSDRWRLRSRNYSISYEILVPSQTEIVSSTGSGDQFVKGARERVLLDAGSGDIEAVDIDGALSIKTGSGDVRVSNVRGSLRVKTGSGEVQALAIKGETVNISTRSGDASLDGQIEEENKWEIHTSSGEASLSLPSHSEFNLSVRTSSGSIDVDFPVNIRGRISRKSIEGSVGSSKAQIICTTSSGDIRIRSFK